MNPDLSHSEPVHFPIMLRIERKYPLACSVVANFQEDLDFRRISAALCGFD